MELPPPAPLPSSKTRNKLAMAIAIDQNVDDEQPLSEEDLKELRLFQQMFGNIPAVRLGLVTTETTARRTTETTETTEKEEDKKEEEEYQLPPTAATATSMHFKSRKQKPKGIVSHTTATTTSLLTILVFALVCLPVTVSSDWKAWLEGFGHDVYRYPEWIMIQKRNCTCMHDKCNVPAISLLSDAPLTFCAAKQYLLQHMPEHDKLFMPPSVSIDGGSMFDDNIAFAMMADVSNTWSQDIPLNIRLAYILPYATYQESRQNWRPLFFAKFYQLIEGSTSAEEAFEMLVAPNLFLNWTAHVWDSRPTTAHETDYNIQWSSSTSPPIIDPFSFVAYGYSSCTGWATMLTYVARSVGIPARQSGTPCWNSIFEGIDYRGRAKDNSNITLCWHAGLNSNTNVNKGGINSYLNNHNWAEIWQNDGSWAWHNDPPTSKSPNSPSLCNYVKGHGCGWTSKDGCSKVVGGPGAAMQDHEIFSVTWSEIGADPVVEGGTIVDAATFPWSPLVWAPGHVAPNGDVMFKSGGLRLVNRTEHYRCKE